MALIDGQITMARFDDCGPRQAGNQHGTADRQCAYKAARFRHEAPRCSPASMPLVICNTRRGFCIITPRRLIDVAQQLM
jgi:hypothetical protein